MPPVIAGINGFIAEHISFGDAKQVNQNYKRWISII